MAPRASIFQLINGDVFLFLWISIEVPSVLGSEKTKKKKTEKPRQNEAVIITLVTLITKAIS